MKRVSSWTLILLISVILLSTFLLTGGKGKKEEVPTEAAAPAVMLGGSQKERAEALAKQYSGVTVTIITEGIAVPTAPNHVVGMGRFKALIAWFTMPTMSLSMKRHTKAATTMGTR